MADTDEQDTIVHLVAALRTHIAQEEEERQRNPEAWLATLEARTQQQWIIQECLRNECETREEQDAAAPCPTGDGAPGLEATHGPRPVPVSRAPRHDAGTLCAAGRCTVQPYPWAGGLSLATA